MKPTETAREDVLAHVVRTYFGDNPEQAVTALLRMSDIDLSESEIDLLEAQREQVELYKHGLLAKLLSGELRVPA